jgi:predicted permease
MNQVNAWILQAGRDLRHGWRMILRMPGLAAVVIVSLGIGIGVNTAVFSWIEALVLQPVPGVRDGGSLMLIEPRGETGSYPGMSWLEYCDLEERLHLFRDLIAFRMTAFNVGEGSHLERTYGLFVSRNYFSALGLRPALGRFPAPDGAAATGDGQLAVISHDFWKTRFSGAAGAVGGTVRVNGQPLTVIGVTPRDFHGTVLGMNFDLWVPANLAPVVLSGSRELESRSARGYAAMGTLLAHATRVQAQTDVDAAMRQLAHDFPETNGKMQAEVLPFWMAPRGPQRFLVGALAALQVVMLLLLLTVCGNTANLVLARASARQREIGVRLALGAGRWRIVSLLLAENLLLGAVSAALGGAIAVWGTQALRAVRISTALPIEFHTAVDGVTLAFAALLGIACGAIFGAAPALQLARIDPQLALRAGSHTSAHGRMRNGLMATQTALALVVLVVAALSLKSFEDARQTDPGFRREGLLLVAYDLTGRNLAPAVAGDFAGRLLARVRALPAVESAAIATSVPLDIHGLGVRPFTLEGRARGDGTAAEAFANTVTPRYFRTMDIRLRAGTDFADLGDAATAPQAVVNEEFVRRYVGTGEPIGRHVDAAGRRYTIAGVVNNSKYDSFTEPPAPIVYFSYRDRPAPLGEIHLRTRIGAEMLLVPAVRRIVSDLDPALPVYNVRTMSEHIDTNLVFRRIPARMFVVLGPLLLALAAIGIYAVVAYGVARRTTEIGVRLALGATPRRLVAQIVGESLGIVGAGALAGWLVAFVIGLDVFGASMDASVFLGVPTVLLIVAGFACWLPVERAIGADPMASLRQE